MRALPYIGVIILWAVTVAGVAFAVEQAFEFDDALLEGTRTPIPGKRVVDLEARRYNVFFEAPDISNPDRVGDLLDDPETSPVRIRVREEGTERLLPLKGYGGTFTVSGGRDSTAIASFEVPKDGRYQLTVTSSTDLPYSNPTVALGEPIGRRVIRLVAGVIVAALAFLTGLLILIVTLVVRSRRQSGEQRAT